MSTGASYTVGAYTPGTIRPGKASRIVVRHTRGGWRIAWRPGANATAQQLTVRFIDGAQVLLSASGTQRSLVLARRLDHGVQPTAIAIIALRGTTRGQITGIIGRPRGAPRR